MQHQPIHGGAGEPAADGMSMQQALQSLHQQIQVLQQQQMLMLQANPGASSASAPGVPPPPRVERPRLPPPSFFEGKSSAFDEWIVELDQQFDWYSTVADADRLRFASAFLKGAARDWWVQLPPADKSSVVTWQQLVDALRRRFQPVTTAELARAKLSVLAQGKSTVHDYVSSFRRLIISLPSMEEGDRLFAFVRGLRPSIATQIRVHGVKTVDAAIEMAVRVGTMGEFAALSSSPASRSPDAMEIDAMIEGLEPESTSSSAPSAQSSSDADGPITRSEFQQLLAAMNDSRRSQSTSSKMNQQGRRFEQKEGGAPRFKVDGMSPEEVREHLDQNKCFYCHKVGHQSRECNKKKKDQGK